MQNVVSGNLKRFLLFSVVTILALTSLTFVTPQVAKANGGYPYANYNGPGTNPSQYTWTDSSGSWLSPYGYGYRNCVDYVAWKVQSMGVPDSKTRGLGNAATWAANAPAKGITVDTNPVPGSLLANSTAAGGLGHIAYVEAVNGNQISISEYNYSPRGAYGTRTNTMANLGFTHVLHYEAYMTTSPSSQVGGTTAPNASTANYSFHGNWTGDSREEFAYVTPRTDNGFDVAIMESTPTGLQWKGIWWSQPGRSGVQYSNTKFIPTDMDGDGYLDLYYSTSTNWNNPGFDMALMHNNGGAGFEWWGSQWSSSTIKLSEIQFIPGNWTGDSREEFAYVTPRSDMGFDIAVMKSTLTGLQWNGIWWSQSGATGPKYTQTKYIPSDMDGDGYTDLYYATSSNWANPGFDMGLQHNSGTAFSWWGQQWNPTNLSLATTRFIPGFWSGGTREGFAYVTPRSGGGSDLSVFASTVSGLVWQGSRISSANLPFSSTIYVAADMDNDGITDLYHVTPMSGGTGFDMGLQHNNGSAFAWWGAQWNPTNLSTSTTQFLPAN